MSPWVVVTGVGSAYDGGFMGRPPFAQVKGVAKFENKTLCRLNIFSKSWGTYLPYVT